MTIIEETYRIVDRGDRNRERGLVAITTTLNGMGPIATDMRLMLLAGEALPEGEYGLQFVKKLAADRRPRRHFMQLVSSNDRDGRS